MHLIATLPTWLMRKFNADAEAWGMSPHSALLIAALPLVTVGAVALIAVLAVLSKGALRPVFRFVTAEDSLLEWLQFAFVLAASLFFALMSVRFVRTGQYGIGLLYLLIAAGTFFIAGEEISWGQRVFGWGTPEALKVINHQGETNVHNIRLVQRAFGYVVLLGGLYGSAVPLLAALWGRLERLALRFLLVPPLFLVPAFLMPFGYRFFRLVIWPTKNAMVVRFGEAPELCLYFGLLAFAWLNLVRLSETREVPAAHVAPVRP